MASGQSGQGGSATRNVDATAGGAGEFHSSVERSAPMTTHGVRFNQLQSIQSTQC